MHEFLLVYPLAENMIIANAPWLSKMEPIIQRREVVLTCAERHHDRSLGVEIDLNRQISESLAVRTVNSLSRSVN